MARRNSSRWNTTSAASGPSSRRSAPARPAVSSCMAPLRARGLRFRRRVSPTASACCAEGHPGFRRIPAARAAHHRHGRHGAALSEPARCARASTGDAISPVSRWAAGWRSASSPRARPRALRRRPVLVAPASLNDPGHPPPISRCAGAAGPAGPSAARRHRRAPLFPRRHRHRLRRALRRRPRPRGRGSSAACSRPSASGRPNLRRFLARITNKALVVWGTEDRLLPASQARSSSRRCRMRNCCSSRMPAASSCGRSLRCWGRSAFSSPRELIRRGGHHHEHSDQARIMGLDSSTTAIS